MSLLSLIAVFLLEQLQPLPYQRVVAGPLSRLAAWVDSRFNAGAYRYGVLAWGLVVMLPLALPGVAHFVLYRISSVAARLLNVGALYPTLGFCQFSHHFSEIQSALTDSWRHRAIAGDHEFFKFSQQVFGIIDWLPLRATTAAFAVVGDFEDAVYSWRNQASQWVDHDLGFVLASGAGGLGVQLGLPVMESGEAIDRSTLGPGAPADVGFMQSAVGLVWRAIVLWMLLLFLLGLASMVG